MNHILMKIHQQNNIQLASKFSQEQLHSFMTCARYHDEQTDMRGPDLVAFYMKDQHRCLTSSGKGHDSGGSTSHGSDPKKREEDLNSTDRARIILHHIKVLNGSSRSAAEELDVDLKQELRAGLSALLESISGSSLGMCARNRTELAAVEEKVEKAIEQASYAAQEQEHDVSRDDNSDKVEFVDDSLRRDRHHLDLGKNYPLSEREQEEPYPPISENDSQRGNPADRAIEINEQINQVLHVNNIVNETFDDSMYRNQQALALN